MREIVVRPPADLKKINSREDFELCYLRHQYLRRVDFNPTEADMKPFLKIVRKMAYNTHSVYNSLFGIIGFNVEDLINIGRVHLTSYLGLYSLSHNQEKFYNFMAKFEKENTRQPNEEEILGKDKADFTLFLKQRMEDVVRVCRQKARNIKGYLADENAFFHGPHQPPENIRTLLEEHDIHGFRKMDLSTFRSMRKKAKVSPSTSVFQVEGVWYVQVPIEKRKLTIEDLAGADFDPKDNFVNMNPEQIYTILEEEVYWNGKQEEFDNYAPIKKMRLMERFIENHKDDVRYKEELGAARKILKSLES